MNYPFYLRDAPVDGHIYGTLSYNRKSRTLDDQGRALRHRACQAPLSRLRRARAGRGALHRAPARDGRPQLADAALSRWRSPSATAQRWEEALAEAREYAVRREAMLAGPQTATPPPGSFSGELLDFQKQGLAFLLAARRCLLADEMGLGKTVQALAFLATTCGLSGASSWCRRT